MYTRHFNIPKNYNGVRFNGADDGISVKEHRPKYDSSVKTSHSPLYTGETQSTSQEQNVFTDTSPEEFDIDAEEDCEASPSECILCEDNDGLTKAVEGEQRHFNLPIKEMLNGIDREDALLICLILLIAAENDKSNNSILTMLSLLLLKR